MKAFLLIALLGLASCDPPATESSPTVLQENCELDGVIKYADNGVLKVRTCYLRNGTTCIITSRSEYEGGTFVSCFKVSDSK